MTTDEKIDRILALVEAMVVRAPAAVPETVADDHDLDGEYGNFVIKKDPKRWDGPSYVGCRLSECAPEYLDVLAGFKEWQIRQEAAKGTDEAAKKAGYIKRDLGRIRGWARRLRAGYKAPAVKQEDAAGGDIPF